MLKRKYSRTQLKPSNIFTISEKKTKKQTNKQTINYINSVAPYKNMFTQLCIALSYIILRFLLLTKSVDYLCVLLKLVEKEKAIPIKTFLLLPRCKFKKKKKKGTNIQTQTLLQILHERGGTICFLFCFLFCFF